MSRKKKTLSQREIREMARILCHPMRIPFSPQAPEQFKRRVEKSIQQVLKRSPR